MTENKDKRVPKGNIKYKVSLTEEQKEAKRDILENKVTILYGKPGTSKTFLAVATAIDMLFKREINSITITRPAVAIENLGFLPGEIDDKIAPYLYPIKDNLYNLYHKEKIDDLMRSGQIKILPIAYIQGITISDVLIVDEAENATEFQLRMILTRLGKGGKMIFTGDIKQSALKSGQSGFDKLLSLNGKVAGLKTIELKTNFRDDFVQEILKLY